MFHLDHYIPLMLQYFHVHTVQAQLFTFFVAFLEALPIIGTIIPGSITMTLIGILIGAKSIPFLLTVAVSTLGAYSGDILGFTTGRMLQHRVQDIWPFKKHPSWLSMSEHFFSKHGKLSIIIGRFAGPIRSTVPLVAGVLKMRWTLFLIAAIISAGLWSLVYMLPGIVLGKLALELPASAMAKFIGYGLLLLLAIWLVNWSLLHFMKQIAKFIQRYTDKTWDWLQRHHPSHKLIQFIRNKNNKDDHNQLLLFFIGCLLAMSFVLLFFLVKHHPSIPINSYVFSLLQSIRNSELNSFAIILTNIGNPQICLVAGTMMSGILFLFGERRKALAFFFSLLTCAGLIVICKHLHFNPRPTGFYHVKKSSSFPSGHTGMSVLLFGFWCYITTQYCQCRRSFIYTITTVTIALIALSRLILGAHWLTDVIGALLLGTSVLLFFLMLLRRQDKNGGALNLSRWLISSMICLFIPSSLYSLTHLAQQLHETAPIKQQKSFSTAIWWQSNKSLLPTFRVNRFGQPSQPLNVQWAGQLDAIRKSLSKLGFKQQNIQASLLKAAELTSKKPKDRLPFFPWLYHNKPAQLLMTKTFESQKVTLEIQLWNSGVKFTEQGRQLWIGSANFYINKLNHGILQNHYKDISYRHETKTPLDLILNSLPRWESKKITVKHPAHRKLIENMRWNQTVTLLRARH